MGKRRFLCAGPRAFWPAGGGGQTHLKKVTPARAGGRHARTDASPLLAYPSPRAAAQSLNASLQCLSGRFGRRQAGSLAGCQQAGANTHIQNKARARGRTSRVGRAGRGEGTHIHKQTPTRRHAKTSMRPAACAAWAARRRVQSSPARACARRPAARPESPAIPGNRRPTTERSGFCWGGPLASPKKGRKPPLGAVQPLLGPGRARPPWGSPPSGRPLTCYSGHPHGPT
jgi:hypothetical protein